MTSAKIDPNELRISSLIDARAKASPGAFAITALGRPALTYGQLKTQIDETISSLNEMGVGRNDRVAMVLPNGPEMAVAFLSVGACATCAPLNPAYRAAEFDFYLGDLNAKALMLQSGIESPARAVAQARGIPIIELTPRREAAAGIFTLAGEKSRVAAAPSYAEPEEVALVLHTSGTTSRPKIVPLAQRNICASAHHIRSTLGLTPVDRCLNVMPLFHIHGLIGATLSSLAAGASIVCTPGFLAPKFFEWLEQFRPTWFTAVPTIHQAILTRAAANTEIIERSQLRLIRSSSAALPPQVMAELERVFNVPVIESYGMTEASHQMASNPLPPRPRKPGSVGVAAGPEIAIMNESGTLLPSATKGEIVIRGRNVTAGYENNPTANATSFTQGWFRTGDQGYLDADGYLFITGRLKEIINRGGEKISPREIDEALLDHPAVAQAVTFAIPHTRLGEEIGSAVVLRENAQATERELRQFAATRLADFKVPYRILLLAEIPKGPTGKLQRIGLAEKLGLKTIDPETSEVRKVFTPPRNPIEASLAEIWSGVLGQQQVGMEDTFFGLGGDSILAAQLISRVRDAFHVELSLLILFEEGVTVPRMAEAIEALKQQAGTLPSLRLQPYGQAGNLALSFAQEGMWFLDQLDPGCFAYNRPAGLRFSGRLDLAVLERSLQEIIHRHEVLRATFSNLNGRPIQIISPKSCVNFSVVDLRARPAADREAEGLRLSIADAQIPFNLAEGPLLRLTLFRLDEAEHLLAVTAHHAIFDGWSMDVFTRELVALYTAFVAGECSPLSPLPIQYADFARWQREWLQSEALTKQLAYWKDQLREAPAELSLPTDRPRPARRTFRGARQPLSFREDVVGSLRDLSRSEGATMFMSLLAAWQMVLSRYAQQDDILVGTPVAGRNRIETEGLIGFFVNTFVLRADLSGEPTFRDLLKRVRTVALNAYAHQDLPFEKLVEVLQPKRKAGRTPLFQVMFVLKRTSPPIPAFVGVTLKPQEIDHGAALIDLNLELWDGPAGLTGYFAYDTDLFDAPTIARMAAHFQTLLENVVARPDERLSKLLASVPVGGARR